MEPWSQRSPTDRRIQVKDRRFSIPAGGCLFRGLEERRQEERRKRNERRDGWLKINRWQSVSVFGS